VKGQLDDVKSAMVENIGKVLERGEQLEGLVDKTDRLQQQAFRFERTSKGLRRALYWRKIKTYLLICAVGVVALFVISLAVCGGFTYGKCRAAIKQMQKR
jgi:vesicle-associated membrane protein 7